MPKYIVIELQTAANGTVGNIVTSYDDLNLAEAKYHTILAAAAVSNLAKHAAVIITEEGFSIDAKCYTHEAVEE